MADTDPTTTTPGTHPYLSTAERAAVRKLLEHTYHSCRNDEYLACSRALAALDAVAVVLGRIRGLQGALHADELAAQTLLVLERDLAAIVERGERP